MSSVAKRASALLVALLLALFVLHWTWILPTRSALARWAFIAEWEGQAWAEQSSSSSADSSFASRLANAAFEQTKSFVLYDPAYRKMGYPMGDVANDRGVCSDVVIRAYRALGFDLQQLVHEDMAKQFSVYPQAWGMRGPDTNIDHRRVPNLMKYFQRHGQMLRPTTSAVDYRAGDIVAWDLGAGVTHVGILVAGDDSSTPFVVHNIGAGPQRENVLFDWRIIGHFRFDPQAASSRSAAH